MDPLFVRDVACKGEQCEDLKRKLAWRGLLC
jgi:hypothetical protein